MKKPFLSFFIFGFLFLLTACSAKNISRPQRECPIEKLLLNQSDYPPDSIFDAINSPIAEKPIESAGQSAYYRDGWTDQIVIRYSRLENAIAEYDQEQKIVFDPDEVIRSWEIPPVFLGMNSISANKYQIACGNVISFGYRCYMIGQYEEYYVFFQSRYFQQRRDT